MKVDDLGDVLHRISAPVYQQSWKVIDEISINNIDYCLIKCKNVYELGFEEEVELPDQHLKSYFTSIFRIELYNLSKFGKKYGYNNLHQVLKVMTADSMRGKTVAKNVYRYFVKILDIQLIGDMEQYFGARKLWTALSKDDDIIVDVIDLDICKTLYTNIILNHGYADEDFDNRIWSYDETKKNIRPVLVNILK